MHLHKDIEDMELEDKHTIRHTITYSNTQFHIAKDNAFF